MRFIRELSTPDGYVPDRRFLDACASGYVPTITRPREVVDAMRKWLARRNLAT